MKVEIIKQYGYDFLWIDNELWMWDIPEEVRLQKDIAVQAFGNVLIAGYGLGIIQKFAIENLNVHSVLTIEKHEEVIQTCKEHCRNIHGEILIKDFYEYDTSNKFDCIIGDMWLEFTNPKYLPEYIKFKDKAKQLLKPNGKILGWGIDFFEYLLARGKNI